MTGFVKQQHFNLLAVRPQGLGHLQRLADFDAGVMHAVHQQNRSLHAVGLVQR
jgi:hypothetical protein